MKPLLIVQTGSAPDSIRARLGDFPHWFRLALGVHPQRLRVVRVDRDEALPPPRMCAGAVITGSAAMVTERAPWSERTAGWIRDAMDAALPLVGVCYGHQLMAHALGGRVDWLPGGREIGTQRVELLAAAKTDPLSRALPPAFRAHTTHEQSVLEPPAGARVLARSERDPHQILRYGERAFSTQFHPEFSTAAMAAYIRRRAAKLREEGLDVPRLLHEVGPTPHARRLLDAGGPAWAGAGG
ncbi:MAG: glutamine amidotransferase [Mizugakiibacter sp.]|uniref:glutamine amidotransferase n=1 Tax=Mizugakiibacter sp. TaxID=1972610 RepID=UPI0031BEB1D6|nr:glutamine amidotransferase [Xanthomonadaceae bacterium]